MGSCKLKYLGSKRRIAKHILPIILANRKHEQWYVEPFAGGMNSVMDVHGKRLANDMHPYLINMWKELLNGWTPKKYTREEYQAIKDNPISYEPHVVGWVGFNCSYSGKWFGGFAGKTKTKVGTVRDYQEEAIRNVSAQVPSLQGVQLSNVDYLDIVIPEKSIVYLDPPYEGTTDYKLGGFNHKDFWDYARELVRQGHAVYVSEYQSPQDFTCVWSKEVKSSLSANGASGGNKNSIEKLFTLI